MNYIKRSFIYLWDFVFEQSFNLFEIIVFSYIWSNNIAWDTLQFWLILIPTIIVSRFCTSVNDVLQRLQRLKRRTRPL